MKTVVCTLTIRLPMASVLAEGLTEEMIRERFEATKDGMTETAMDGSEFSLTVTTEGE